MGTARMGLRGGGRSCGRRGSCGNEALEQLDLVEGGLCIAGSGFHNLEGYMAV